MFVIVTCSSVNSKALSGMKSNEPSILKLLKRTLIDSVYNRCMAAPILVTKFFIPPVRKGIVERRGLINRLNDGLDCKMTLISAPAGFGKTTLISHWVDNFKHGKEFEEQTTFIAWLSLDENDNDPVRFLTYFVTAINQVKESGNQLGSGTLAILQSAQSSIDANVVIPLINDLAMNNSKIIFVLDDYHLIEAQTIHGIIAYLIENLPPQLHLIIATRQDPPFTLSRMRACNQLNELRAVNLRFTPAEVADFLNHVMGLNLSAPDISELESRTEGWIAGLQLAAISIQGHQDRAEFIKAFTGGHRLVLDFLIEEVLDQQTEEIKNFLLKTAILKRMTGPLCNAITGQENGQDTLETLNRANLFIVPLDEERRWFRYHHLFADLLQLQLVSRKKDLINALHSKAAIWHETMGDLSEAVHHALEAGESETAVRLIERGAVAAIDNSDFRFILDTVKRLPESVVQNSPWLFIYHAWALLLTGHVEASNPKLKKIDGLLDQIYDYDEIQQREMLGNIAGLRMISASWNRRHEELPEYSRQVREFLPENNWIRGLCAIMLGGFYWGNGNLAASIDAFAESAHAGEASGNKMVAVSGACNQAESLELAGHLVQAVDLLQDTFSKAEQDGRLLPVAGYIHIGLARVCYEFNRLDEANQHLLEAIKLGQQMADRRAEKIIYGLLTRIEIAEFDFENAYRSVQNTQHAVPIDEVDYDLRGSDYPQVWLWLKTNKIRKLERWFKEKPICIEEVTHFKTKFTLTMHARVLMALYREHQDEIFIRKAIELLDNLLELAENNGWGGKVIKILALQAVTFHEIGKPKLAQIKLAQALTLAKPDGYIRTFVDEGPLMAALLYEALKHEMMPDYVQRLLAAFPKTCPKEGNSTSPRVDQSELVEPLSDREIEVVELLAKGLTNQGVAEKLFLSVHTIKTHTRNIYGKLNVNNRTQAVNRARTLGILPPL